MSIEADSKFCAQCGSKLHETSANERPLQSERPRKMEKDPTSTPLGVAGICILVVLVGTLLFSVLHKSTGSEFVGKWKDTDGSIVEIVEDGDSFFMFKEGEKGKLPLKLNDNGTLHMGNMLGTNLDLKYFKTSDAIILLGHEMQRVK